MIVYKLTDGWAHDLRFEKSGYKLASGEKSLTGDVLPDINTLHSPEVRDRLAAREQRDEAIEVKIREIAKARLEQDGEWQAEWPELETASG